MGSLGSAASTVVLGSLAAGFLYLLLTGIQWARRIRASLDSKYSVREWRSPEWCIRCGRVGSPREDCSSCLKTVCHGCSLLSPSQRLCTTCIKLRDKELSSGVWIFKDLRERFKSTVANIQRLQKNYMEDIQLKKHFRRHLLPTDDLIYIPVSLSPVQRRLVEMTRKKKVQSSWQVLWVTTGRDEDVRDVIEKLTGKLVGGSLDNVRISQLSTHPAYMGFMERYQGVLSLTLSRLSSAFQISIESSSKDKRDPGKHVHLQLKELIKEIIHEANGLPIFKGYKKKGRNSAEDLSTKTYEDILATAILNKIVEKFQFQLKQPNAQPMNFQIAGDDSDDNVYKSEESLGPDDWMSTSTDPASLTERKEGTTPTNSSDDESYDEFSEEREFEFHQTSNIEFPELGIDFREGSSFKSSPNDRRSTSSWEGNWLFKKKKLKNKPQSPVAMLVPSPNEDVKAQIGGTDADETSDLSDYSESELVELLNSSYKNNPGTIAKERYSTDFKTAIRESRKSFHEELISLDTVNECLSSSETKPYSSNNLIETRNFELKDFNSYTGEDSLGIEQDSEYTESYETMEQLDSTNLRNDPEVYCRNKVMEGDQLHNSQARENEAATQSESSASLDDGKCILPSVRQLAKHFSGKHNYSKVHSLTARNLARGLQDNNKQKSLEALEKEVWCEGKTKPRTRIHSNIAFWEELAHTKKH